MKRSSLLGTRSAAFAALAALAALAAVFAFGGAGCGGSGGGSGGGNTVTGTSGTAATGRFAMTFKWPARPAASSSSRLIPLNTQSVVAVLTSGSGAVLGTRTIVGGDGAPPVSTVTFDNLQPGPVVLTATAFPQTDGTGVALATGSVPSTIVSGKTATVSLTMNSTIDHLDVTPANPSITAGQSVTLTATPRDANGNAVLVTGSNISWVSANPAIVVANLVQGQSVTATGIAAGTSLFTATERDSGKQGSTLVTVPANTVQTRTTIPVATTIDSTGKFLYVADQQSKTISQFRIGADGTLSPLTPAFITVAQVPLCLQASRVQGSHALYVGATDSTSFPSQAAIFQFNINDDGTLTPLEPATAPSLFQAVKIVVDPLGRFAYEIGGFGTGTIRQFTINADGTLTQNGADALPNDGFASTGAAIAPNGNFLFTSSGPDSFRVNATGLLIPVSATFLVQSGTAMTVDPSGTHLYVTSFSGGLSGGVQALTIDANGGMALDGTKISFANNMYDCAITPNGKFVYVVGLLAINNIVGQFAVNADGTLTALSPATVTAGIDSTGGSTTVSPDGQFLYVTNPSESRVYQFRINADGTLTPLSPAFING